MNAFGSDCIRALMRKGLSTADIAQRINCAEADVWNVLVRSELAASAAGRVAPVRGRFLPTLPGGVRRSPAIFREADVRVGGAQDHQRALEAVELLSDTVTRRGSIGGVHQLRSGGIGRP